MILPLCMIPILLRLEPEDDHALRKKRIIGVRPFSLSFSSTRRPRPLQAHHQQTTQEVVHSLPTTPLRSRFALDVNSSTHTLGPTDQDAHAPPPHSNVAYVRPRVSVPDVEDIVGKSMARHQKERRGKSSGDGKRGGGGRGSRHVNAVAEKNTDAAESSDRGVGASASGSKRPSPA